MKKLLVVITIVMLIFALFGCGEGSEIKAAFDLDKYSRLATTITITKDDALLLEEKSIVIKGQDLTALETMVIKTLAPISSDTQYTTETKTVSHDSLEEYFKQLRLDPKRLTADQLSQIVEKDGNRELKLISLTDAEIKFLFGEGSSATERKDFTLTIQFSKQESLMKSLSYSYLTPNQNRTTVTIEFL